MIRDVRGNSAILFFYRFFFLFRFRLFEASSQFAQFDSHSTRAMEWKRLFSTSLLTDLPTGTRCRRYRSYLSFFSACFDVVAVYLKKTKAHIRVCLLKIFYIERKTRPVVSLPVKSAWLNGNWTVRRGKGRTRKYKEGRKWTPYHRLTVANYRYQVAQTWRYDVPKPHTIFMVWKRKLQKLLVRAMLSYHRLLDDSLFSVHV